MEPKVLLMDEPLSNLDAKLREVMRTEIRRIQQALGITSVYVTHDQVEAMTLSDRIVVMNQGRIEQIGSPTEIYRHPRSAFVADFIGRTNFIEGLVRDVNGAVVAVEALGQLLSVPRPNEQALTAGQPVRLVVRPEAIRVVEQGGQYRGVVHWASYLGSLVEYDIEVAGQHLGITEADPRQTATIYTPGREVSVQLLEDCIYILPAE
jgi:iron(III) transport system ATP-binding protein